MRYRLAQLLFLPVLLAGCMDLFFAPPIDQSGGPGWKDMGIVLYDADTSGAVEAAFAPDGTAYCLHSHSAGLQVMQRIGSGWVQLGTIPGTGWGLPRITVDDSGNPYVAACSGMDVSVFDWNGNTFVSNHVTNAGAAPTLLDLKTGGDGRVLLAYTTGSDIIVFREEGVWSNVCNLSSALTYHHLTLHYHPDYDIMVFASSESDGSVLYGTNTDSGGPLLEKQAPDITNGQALVSPPDYGKVHSAWYDINNFLMKFQTIDPGPLNDWEGFGDVAPDYVYQEHRMVQYRPGHTMYLAVRTSTDQLVLYSADGGGWTRIAGPLDSSKVAYSYDLAVAPDGRLWLFAVVQRGEEALHDLRAYRYDP